MDQGQQQNWTFYGSNGAKRKGVQGRADEIVFCASMASRYGKKAQEKVKRAMHEMKHGALKSGRSGKTVRSRKQAIAIGLSQARRMGGKVPRAPRR